MPRDPAATLDVEFLPARQGDAIWIRWGEPAARHQMIVDMGTRQTGQLIHRRLTLLPEHERRLELLVNTHVDSDHIAGMLTCVSHPDQPIAGLEFGDVWFNGREHLAGDRVPEPPTGLEPWGPAQGQQFADWLRSRPWNQWFDRGPVVRDGAVPRCEIADGLTLSVLGPTRARLASLIDDWDAIVERELAVDDADRPMPPPPGLESFGANPEPDLHDWADLEDLAHSATPTDRRAANGSSIALLLEWRGRSVLLCGDAFADDIVDGLTALGSARPHHIDMVKLPHHGSAKNVTSDLVAEVDSARWVFSTDGTTHNHPDSIAIARVIHGCRDRGPAELVFNVPSTYNGWWDRDDWRAQFGYTTTYGTPETGVTVQLEPDD